MPQTGPLSSLGGVAHYNQSSVWTSQNYLKSESEYKRFQTVLSLIPSSICSLLDVGAGNGAFIHLMEGTRYDLILQGLEPSRVAIENSICTTPITCASADCIPFAEHSFDMTTCLEVIEHLPYGIYEESLDEIARVTKYYICVSVPYRERRTMLKCSYCGSTFPSWFHLRSFDEYSMERLFRGFELIRLVKIIVPRRIPFPSPLWILNNVLRLGPKPMGLDTICPSCGFRKGKHGQANEHHATGSRSVIEQCKYKIKNMMPIKNERRWMVALYSSHRDLKWKAGRI